LTTQSGLKDGHSLEEELRKRLQASFESQRP
jgi:hypothetical protein